MRSLMISVTIIMFTFCITILNSVDANYAIEKNRSLYGWNTTSPLTPDSSEFTGITNNGVNKTLHQLSTPRENPIRNFVDTVWSSFIWVYQGIKLIVNVLINSSLKFSSFIQHLGHGEEFTLVPAYIANIMSIFVNLNHVLAIFQIAANRS